MFINSIFLPKAISDQKLTDTADNSIGNFTHLFSNVFRFVKDGQENSAPIQLCQSEESSVENPQNELLKVSLLADNKIVRENSSISMIVSMFMSQFRPGEKAPQIIESGKVKTSEHTPKYFSLSKNDLVKEIKNLFNSLDDIDVSQSGNAEILLLASGISIPLNIEKSNYSEIENLVVNQINTKSDFKFSIQIGNQKLTLDVEPVIEEKSLSVYPVEIVTDDADSDTNEIIRIESKENNINQINQNNTKTGGTSQPQLQGSKQALDNLDVKTDIDWSKVPETDDNKIINNSTDVDDEKIIVQNQTTVKNSSKIVIPDSAKQNNEPGLLAKDVSSSLDMVKPLQVTDKSDNLNTMSADKSDSKVVIKSDQKINSGSVNSAGVDKRSELNILAEETDLKEIKIDTPKFVKNSSTNSKINQEIKQNSDYKAPVFKETDISSNHIELKPKSSAGIINSVKPKNDNKIFLQQELAAEENNEIIKPELSIKTEVKNLTNHAETKDRPVEKVTNYTQPQKAGNYKTTIKVSKSPEVNIKSETTGDQKTIVKNSDTASLQVEETKSTKKNNSDVRILSEEADETQQKPSVVKENTQQTDKSAIIKEKQNNEVKDQKVGNDLTKVKSAKTPETKTASNENEHRAVKINYRERRVYSQIPELKIISDENTDKNAVQSKMPSEPVVKETTRNTDEVGKQLLSNPEIRQKDEKQVWVKVSVEKNETENSSELKKRSDVQNKISFDAKEVKKEFSANGNQDYESQKNPQAKQEAISVERVQNTEVSESFKLNQSSINDDNVLQLKPEQKTEQLHFKSEINSETIKHNTRAAEMIEKIKVISSSEMVKEVYKVIEANEKQSVVLKLVPRELGAIKVTLDTIENVLTAKVEVENETVGQIIRNNVEQLRQNLLQSGVQVNSISITYNSSQQKQHGFNNQKRKNNPYQQENNIDEAEEAVIIKKMGYNTYEYLA
ncbi:MAG: flagellar hook-length control protein FliK [Ignavibacterium sp.]|jgi:flagellar hook-length control protein FliK|nr:flagellar hook-length control protein FliK [Ignavibacterium sp.]